MTTECIEASGQGTTRLHYDLTTNPFPLQANAETGTAIRAQMTITATNGSGSDVPLQGLIIQLPVGDGAASLVAHAKGIEPVPPPNWTLADTAYCTGFARYIFQPGDGQGTLGKDLSLEFVFNDVEPNQMPGSATLTVIEGSNNCDPYKSCPQAAVQVMKWPYSWGQVKFWTEPDPPIVNYGEGVRLHWEGPAGPTGQPPTYTIDYYTAEQGIVHLPKPGGRKLANVGQYPASKHPPLQLLHNTTFYLSVEDTVDQVKYQARAEVTVTVVPPKPEISFTITADPVVPGQPLSFTLHWSLKNVSRFQITANDGPMGQERTLSIPEDVTSYRVIPTQLNTVYTLHVHPVETRLLRSNKRPRV